jgi:DNA-binding NarL/FixJ family response regulator
MSPDAVVTGTDGAGPRRSRILLADDHALVRQGLRRILDAEPDLEVVAEAGDGAAAVERIQAGGIDLAVLDVSMPRLTGLQAARELVRGGSTVPVLILSMYDHEQYLFEALNAGAAGYVHKSVADTDLIDACRAALRGEPFLYPGALQIIIRDYMARSRSGQEAAPSVLTPREEEVLKLIAEGYSGREIAETLVISIKTVDRHRSNLLAKLGLRDRVDLVRYAIRSGLIEA